MIPVISNPNLLRGEWKWLLLKDTKEESARLRASSKQYGFTDLDDAERSLYKDKGVDVDGIVRGVQPIAFENAVWAYTLGAAIALKKGCKTAAEAATAIGEGLQAFCIPGSVADQRAGGPGPWQPGRHAAEREHQVLCLPGRP